MSEEKNKVLVTEDNEVNAMIIQSVINGFGIEADIAASGMAAIEAIKSTEYSLIFMDHMMPDMDGLETTKRIRSISNVPIIAVSASLDDELMSEFIAAGAQEGLTKPVDSARVGEILSKYIYETEEKESSNNLPDNDENYYHMLKASTINILLYIDMIENYRETDNERDLLISVHSLKSIFAGIGMKELSSEAAELEDRIKSSGIDKTMMYGLELFLEKIKITNQELKRSLEEYERSGKTEVMTVEIPLSDEEMTEAIGKTIKALERFEIDAIIEGLERLKLASVGKRRMIMEKAIEAANMFDYDFVREAITEFTSR